MRTAIRALERLPDELAASALVVARDGPGRAQLGFDPDEEPEGREARERQAALSTLLAIVTERLVRGTASRQASESRRRSSAALRDGPSGEARAT